MMIMGLLAFLAVPQASAVVTANLGDLRVIQSQQDVTLTTTPLIACRSIPSELVRVARARCESQARAEVTRLGGQPLGIVNFSASVIREGNRTAHYDGSMEVTDCQVTQALVRCEVGVLSSSSAR